MAIANTVFFFSKRIFGKENRNGIFFFQKPTRQWWLSLLFWWRPVPCVAAQVPKRVRDVTLRTIALPTIKKRIGKHIEIFVSRSHLPNTQYVDRCSIGTNEHCVNRVMTWLQSNMRCWNYFQSPLLQKWYCLQTTNCCAVSDCILCNWGSKPKWIQRSLKMPSQKPNKRRMNKTSMFSQSYVPKSHNATTQMMNIGIVSFLMFPYNARQPRLQRCILHFQSRGLKVVIDSKTHGLDVIADRDFAKRRNNYSRRRVTCCDLACGWHVLSLLRYICNIANSLPQQLRLRVLQQNMRKKCVCELSRSVMLQNRFFNYCKDNFWFFETRFWNVRWDAIWFIVNQIRWAADDDKIKCADLWTRTMVFFAS